MNFYKNDKIAIWAITPGGAALAGKISGGLSDGDVFLPDDFSPEWKDVIRFDRLRIALQDQFKNYSSHIFIMSTGIVVRLISTLIRHKTKDPAILVIDEKARHVISLLSGHIGGANALTIKVAEMINADPVITTATDINDKTSIDVLALENDLIIENPEAIKYVNMAIINNERLALHDPYSLLSAGFEGTETISFADRANKTAGVFIDDRIEELSGKNLILRPMSLVAGVGCNRGADHVEIKGLLSTVLEKERLSSKSLKFIACIDLKADEPGLLKLAEEMGLPLRLFSKEELNSVNNIQNPSTIVERHIGVKSVCEAAAILGANQGCLILPKHKTKNVTVAIARVCFS